MSGRPPVRLRSALTVFIAAIFAAIFAAGCGDGGGTGPGGDGDGDGDGNGGGTPPAAPSGVAAWATGADGVRLRWQDNAADETGFQVERSTQAAAGYALVASVDADGERFVDTGLSAATTYYYRVRAVRDGDASEPSSPVEITTLTAPDPAAPLECRRLAYPCTWPEVDPELYDESDRLGDELLTRFEAGESVAAVRTWLEGEAELAAVRSDDEAIRFRLPGGRPVWVLSPAAILGGVAPAERPDTRPIAVGGGPSRSVVGDEPKSKRALVLSVYQYDFGADDDGAEVAAILEATRGYEGNVDFYSNTATQAEISKQQFQNWGAYDAIHVSSHGKQLCRDGGEDCTTVILGGAKSRTLILEDAGEGVDLVKIEYGEADFGASTDFFRATYPQGLPNTIVFVSACETFNDDDLAEALSGGGGAYLGWQEPVLPGPARQAAVAFFQRLSEKGVPAESGYRSLQGGGNDLTDDGDGATLQVYQEGDDLRLREVVFPRNPLTKQDLPQDAPYPVVGTPEDGSPDKIPYLVKVDGVEGDPGGFTVTVTVNGFTGEPKALSEGEIVDGDDNVWQVKGTVDVPFDAQQGQQVEVKAEVDLPEGGRSEWDETPDLGNPTLRFRTRIETEGGNQVVARFVSELEAEFDLALDEELEKLQGMDELRYTTYDLTVRGDTPCFISGTTTTDGTLQVVDGDFTVSESGEPVLPERLVILIPPEVEETWTATCPEGTTTQSSIHFFSTFYAYHGGALCGAENEVDQAAGGLVVRNWSPGTGEVWARREYDRQCTLAPEPVTVRENTTLELLDPGAEGG